MLRWAVHFPVVSFWCLYMTCTSIESHVKRKWKKVKWCCLYVGQGDVTEGEVVFMEPAQQTALAE